MLWEKKKLFKIAEVKSESSKEKKGSLVAQVTFYKQTKRMLFCVFSLGGSLPFFGD